MLDRSIEFARQCCENNEETTALRFAQHHQALREDPGDCQMTLYSRMCSLENATGYSTWGFHALLIVFERLGLSLLTVRPHRPVFSGRCDANPSNCSIDASDSEEEATLLMTRVRHASGARRSPRRQSPFARKIHCLQVFNIDFDILQLFFPSVAKPFIMEEGKWATAHSPFDDDAADFILYTSDDVVFRVYRLILCQASAGFAGIIVLPHPPPEGAAMGDYIDGLPVCRVTEDSKTIDTFLRCCYPVTRPVVNVSNFIAVYKAGEKYQADLVVQYALEEFKKFAAETRFCLQAYALACHLRLRKEAELAAKTTLRMSRDDIMRVRGKELELMSISAYTHLLQYHQDCHDRVAQLCHPNEWVQRDAIERSPMWEMDDPARVSCCLEDPEIFAGPRVDWKTRLAWQENPEMMNVQPPDACYKAKVWCMRYIRDLEASISNGNNSLYCIWSPRALDAAARLAFECSKCRLTAVESLVGLTKDIQGSVDEEIAFITAAIYYPTYKDAQSPFNDPTADLVIVTSDNVSFRVHKLILSKASPVFEGLYSLPQPPPERAATEDYIDGIPLMRVTEDSSTMDKFLRCCYPIPRPSLLLGDIIPVYRAGEKYQVECVTQHASSELVSPQSFRPRNNSLRIYAIACHLGLREEAKTAAKETLSISLHELQGCKCPEMSMITALSYVNLLQYHRRCRHLVSDQFLNPQWCLERGRGFSAMFTLASRPSKCCDEYEKTYHGYDVWFDEDGQMYDVPDAPYRAKKWAIGYMKELEKIVDSGRVPIRETVRASWGANVALRTALECPTCRGGVVDCLNEFGDVFQNSVDEFLSNVAFDPGF
ncbi:hypothetical protein NM688_g5840 [Phlebia brevispora]|uniref:Uncharacterized protein n=1 Tax=Phlebia brevispora TaxID=194682 RepID=A0ACC1SNV8_9APHY|nr:hypothetical protein NM688_g5840 [Phlebia brevispora]